MEKKFKEHEDFYTTEVAELKELSRPRPNIQMTLNGRQLSNMLRVLMKPSSKFHFCMLTWASPPVAILRKFGTGSWWTSFLLELTPSQMTSSREQVDDSPTSF